MEKINSGPVSLGVLLEGLFKGNLGKFKQSFD